MGYTRHNWKIVTRSLQTIKLINTRMPVVAVDRIAAVYLAVDKTLSSDWNPTVTSVRQHSLPISPSKQSIWSTSIASARSPVTPQCTAAPQHCTSTICPSSAPIYARSNHRRRSPNQRRTDRTATSPSTPPWNCWLTYSIIIRVECRRTDQATCRGTPYRHHSQL